MEKTIKHNVRTFDKSNEFCAEIIKCAVASKREILFLFRNTHNIKSFITNTVEKLKSSGHVFNVINSNMIKFGNGSYIKFIAVGTMERIMGCRFDEIYVEDGCDLESWESYIMGCKK